MGLCIIWIFGNRLVELIQGLVNALASALLQVKASFHVELVGLGILGGMPFLLATYLQPQLAGNIGGNVVLQGSDIGGFALVLLTPDLRAVGYIYHLSRDAERVTVLREAAHNDRTHLQVAPDLLRILLRLAVAEDCRASHHPQLWQPREMVDYS